MSDTVAPPTCAGCGREITEGQPIEHGGALYCADCVREALDGKTTQRQALRRNPTVAVVLSLLPGLGQMYCGQTLKGVLVLAAFLGVATARGLFLRGIGPIAIPTLYFWNLFDAYWTAQRVNRAELPSPPPPSFPAPRWESATTPAWGVLLILLGVLFLLNNFGVTWLTYERLWPSVLLGLGLWMLIVFAISRRAVRSADPAPQETCHDESASQT